MDAVGAPLQSVELRRPSHHARDRKLEGQWAEKWSASGPYSTLVLSAGTFAGGAYRCIRKEPNVKVVGVIQFTQTQEVKVCHTAREQLIESIPEGFELIRVRRDS